MSIPDNLKLIESKLGALSGKPYKLTVKVTDDDTSEDVLKRLKTLLGTISKSRNNRRYFLWAKAVFPAADSAAEICNKF